MRSTAVSPAALSRCLAASMNGPSCRYTVSPWTTMPRASPERRVTICRWAMPDGLVPRRGELRARHHLPDLLPHEAGGRRHERRGEALQPCRDLRRQLPCAASAVIASFASPCTSTYSKTVVVIRLVSASCTAGSAASGLTVSTNRSVSESWLWVQTATRDTRSQHAAEDDQHRGEDRPPAELPSAAACHSADTIPLRSISARRKQYRFPSPGWRWTYNQAERVR